MTHLRYLRYVLIHKLYVFMAGVAVHRHATSRPQGWWRTLWRLAIHDLSKFRPSEWRPYATYFYGPNEVGASSGQQQARFNYAWLLHQHRQPHHWQHWILREDSGKTLVLVPPAYVVDEMVADWLGAGTKVLRWPSLSECVGETIAWYMKNRERILVRDIVRERVERTLYVLAAHYGLLDLAYQVQQAKHRQVKIEVAR